MERFGLYSHFETDEHKTLPFIPDKKRGGYLLGGESLAMGASVIEVPAQEMERLGRKPKVDELIDMIRNKVVNMYGRVFAMKRKDAMTLFSERARIPDDLKRIWKKYDHALKRRYLGMLVNDFFDSVFEGQFGIIKGMPGK
jgi:hypothetical protein